MRDDIAAGRVRPLMQRVATAAGIAAARSRSTTSIARLPAHSAVRRPVISLRFKRRPASYAYPGSPAHSAVSASLANGAHVVSSGTEITTHCSSSVA